MLKTITIQGINIKPYEGVDKFGKSYVAKIVGVFDGNVWYSLFDKKNESSDWKKGDSITVEVTETTDKMGKLRYNISIPKAEDALKADIEKLKKYMNLVVSVLDEAFPGWRDELKPKQTEEFNLDSISKNIESMNTKITANENANGTRADGAIY